MIVDDLDVRGAGRRPAKADAELVVDANAVLASAISLEGFEPIPRWHAHIVITSSATSGCATVRLLQRELRRAARACYGASSAR